MNRQFQAKIQFGNYVLLAALLSVAICLIWQTTAIAKQFSGLLIALDLFLMVLIVERMIHSTYTVTSDNLLVIHRGRLSKDIVISIDEIDRIDRINRMRIGGKPLQTFIVVVLRDGKEFYINPKNEEDFIRCIAKRRS